MKLHFAQNEASFLFEESFVFGSEEKDDFLGYFEGD